MIHLSSSRPLQPLRSLESIEKEQAHRDDPKPSPAVGNLDAAFPSRPNSPHGPQGGGRRLQPNHVARPGWSFVPVASNKPMRSLRDDGHTTIIMNDGVDPNADTRRDEEIRALADTMRALFPAPHDLDAAGRRHWERCLTSMLTVRVRELQEAGVTADMALSVASIIARHGHRSGVSPAVAGIAGGQSAMAAARVAQFFAAPATVIAGVAAVAGAMGAGAARIAWDAAVERVFQQRLSSDPEQPAAHLLREMQRSDDRSGFMTSVNSSARQEIRHHVVVDGLDLPRTAAAIANHLIPMRGPQPRPSLESLASIREVQRFALTAPPRAFTDIQRSRRYTPQRFGVDGAPLEIGRQEVQRMLRNPQFLWSLPSAANLGRLVSTPATVAFQYAANATRTARTVLNEVMDTNTSAIVPNAAGASVV